MPSRPSGLTRRGLLGASSAAIVASTIGTPPHPANASGAKTMARVERTATRIVGFQSPEMDFQLMRSLGAANYGGGAPGEIFATRKAIDGDDPYAWPPAFGALGERVRKAGEEAERRGRKISARDHFLRASMYLRSAEYFADAFSPRARAYGMACRDAFIGAARNMADRVEPIEVPFEGRKLPGYFMMPAGGAPRGRTILILTGFDGTGEELYFEAARAGLERGFNVLVAEGPGQTGCMRFNPELVFRPDYERPIGAMIDYAFTRREVSAERFALYGISLGGYFALRAGEHDARIRALILNSPIVDLRAYMAGFLGPGGADNAPPVKLSEVDEIPDAEFPRAMKLGFKAACRRYGVDSFAAWFERLKTFNAVDGLADVKCPSLAMAGAGEGGETAAQFERFCTGVSGPVTRRMFTAEEGADMHCQMGNLPLSCAVLYDWLEERLAA
jgi:pimeloyl-ACP methyl ester carboxylesterase